MFCNYDSWKLGVLIVGISWAVAGSGGPVIAGQDLSGDVTPQDSDLGAGTERGAGSDARLGARSVCRARRL